MEKLPIQARDTHADGAGSGAKWAGPCPRCGRQDWARNSKDARINDRFTLRVPLVCKTYNLLLVPRARVRDRLAGLVFVVLVALGVARIIVGAVRGLPGGEFLTPEIELAGGICAAWFTVKWALVVLHSGRDEVRA